MKGVLEFDLPEDRVSHLVAVHAMDWAIVVDAMDQALRTAIKYGHEYKSIEDALTSLRDFLATEMYDRGISLDMIE